MKTIVQLVEKLKIYLVDKDTKAKQAVEANIAPVETDASSSSSAYAVGAQLILNDVLYDVTSSISVGDAIAVGINITPASKLSANIKTKQDQIEVTTMPTASASNVGKVLIYIGATTSTYTSGQSYQSTLEGGNYIWKPTSINSVDASDVTYDNQTSRLTATDAQAAIDELASKNKELTEDFIPKVLTVTPNSSYVDNNNLHATKYGQLVILSGYFHVHTKAARGEVLYTLPSSVGNFSGNASGLALGNNGSAILLTIGDDNTLKVEASDGISTTWYSIMMVMLNKTENI